MINLPEKTLDQESDDGGVGGPSPSPGNVDVADIETGLVSSAMQFSVSKGAFLRRMEDFAVDPFQRAFRK